MAIFAITFRLASDSTYQSRWDNVQDKVKEIAGYIYWKETTSFFLVSYDGNASALDNAIYFGSQLHNQDLMVVINLSDRHDYAVRGPYSDKDIDKLLTNR